MRNKIIVIEGTDCSGKQTQSDRLLSRLNSEGYSIFKTYFPNYDSPTGYIIGQDYLGKGGKGLFKEGAGNVDPKVSGLYYAADRKYNMPKLLKELEHSHVLLDRYIDSNLAHQGGKIDDDKERFAMYDFFDKLEYGLLELPKADIRILLYLPYQYGLELKKSRSATEILDEHESDPDHLKKAERAYLEIAKRNDYKIINVADESGKIRTIEDIHEELYAYVKGELDK